MKLREYLGKQVKIIDIDGKEWIGFVKSFVPKIDNDVEDEISLHRDGFSGLIGFGKSEIKSIEIVGENK